jgi:hypothetical protein
MWSWTINLLCNLRFPILHYFSSTIINKSICIRGVRCTTHLRDWSFASSFYPQLPSRGRAGRRERTCSQAASAPPLRSAPPAPLAPRPLLLPLPAAIPRLLLLRAPSADPQSQLSIQRPTTPWPPTSQVERPCRGGELNQRHLGCELDRRSRRT